MELILHKKTEAINTPVISFDGDENPIEYGAPFAVMLWKFKDQYGNLWNTETPIDGTEEDAASIILGSIQSA